MRIYILLTLCAFYVMSNAETYNLGVIPSACVAESVNLRTQGTSFFSCASSILLPNGGGSGGGFPAVMDANYGHFGLCRITENGNSVYIVAAVASDDVAGQADITCPSNALLLRFSVALKTSYNITGVVMDAVTLVPIANNATATIPSTGVNATTDANGQYTITAPNGTNTLTVNATGYFSDDTTLLVTQDITTSVDFALSATIRNVNQYRIVTTWGPDADLDSYLQISSSPGCTVFYAHKECSCDGGGTDSSLNVDNVSGYGPETVDILDITACSGDFTFEVNTYSVGVNSEATVKLYGSSGLLRVFTRNTATFTTGEGFWKVFTLTAGGVLTTVDTTF